MPHKKDIIKLLAQSVAIKTYILQSAKRSSKHLQLKIILNILNVKNERMFFNKSRFNVFINKSLQFIFLPE